MAGLWSVWLITRRNIWTWPIGIVNVVIYFAIFYKLRLYADVVEQVFYFVTNIYGWWLWSKSRQKADDDLPVYRSSNQFMVLTALGALAASYLAYLFLAQAHTFSPFFFPEKASLPLPDGLTTVFSFVATGLMISRRIECWVYWIIVDVISVWLYYTKGVWFIALLFAIFLVLAFKGLFSWLNAYKQRPLAA